MSYTLAGGRTEEPSTNFLCQFCSANLSRLSTIQRQAHYDKHFGDEPAAASASNASSSKKPAKESNADNGEGSSKSWKDWLSHKSQDNFWYPAQTTEPPRNFTPGLIPLLKTHLRKSHAAGHTQRAVLCYERAVLVTRQVWDANWGCGYRNFLMACASLMDQPFQPMYFPLLDEPIPPSVKNLQQIIEGAWADGFDPEGARELKKLVGTTKRIGTADIQIAFTFRGIPSRLVDFDIEDKEGGTDVLTDWVREYFSQPHGVVDKATVLRPKTVNEVLRGASPVTATSRMPFILQHDGHSRTIVGYEVNKNGAVNLLEFDPSKILKSSMHQAGIDSFSSMPRPHNPAAASPSSKRPATASSLASPPPLKRSRCDNQAQAIVVLDDDDDNDDDVIIVSDSRDQNSTGRGKGREREKKADQAGSPSTSDVLKFFRLNPKKLGKKKKYQVLYFPVSHPLSASEKRSPAMNGFGEKIP